MTVGITGANGQLGRKVIQALKTRIRATEIVALVRSTAKGTGLGVQVREADYDRPATLDSALPGIDTLLLISGSEVGRRIAQHRNVIAAAKNAGVKRIVYTSLLHADTSPLSLADEHRTTEAALKESGPAVHHPAQRLVHGELHGANSLGVRERRSHRGGGRREDIVRHARGLCRRGRGGAHRRCPRRDDL